MAYCLWDNESVGRQKARTPSSKLTKTDALNNFCEIELDRSFRHRVLFSSSAFAVSECPWPSQLATVTDTVPSVLQVFTLCVCLCWSHKSWRACTQQIGTIYYSRTVRVAILASQGFLTPCGLPGCTLSQQRRQQFTTWPSRFLAEERTTSKDGFGSMFVFKAHNIIMVVFSTTASELYSFTKCFGRAFV